ncbi:LamG-like jellyroll fold domain-containing protein [Sulfuriroseicoccus oceanibius]|uniref:FecR protein domain-containing protein n=1 Tax=Sulfuriroseicoccus oceanibius TaxID=2707525 RepID=A0A6B3L555_9BACT|nr:LamG-like jellyroll fold domain-containing protein [Sulfuriroseicoccus oceanibius]QQL45857.1 hypothetical protein G3M56_004545 [Sulfuriroseicoccus oceanibius]
MNREKLESAVYDLLDGVLNQEQVNELEWELGASEEAREIYREAVKMHSALALRGEGRRQMGRPASVVPMERVVQRQRRKIVRIAAVAAAAVIVLGAVVMRMIHVPVDVELAAFEVSVGTRYELVHSSGGGRVDGLKAGTRMTISQGVVELQFDSGVRSVVQAPADLTLVEEGLVRLDEGVAWFHVPEEAVGFEVVAREVTVVDLGTEFGVVTGGGVPDEVHVFKGRVAASSRWAEGSPDVELVANEACRVGDADELVRGIADGREFATSLPDGLPYLHWSFDGEDQHQVAGTYAAAARLKVVEQRGVRAPSVVPGVVGSGLAFNGQQQAVVTDWPGLAGNRARTVSFWVRIPEGSPPNGLGGIVGWGDRSRYGGKWKVLVTGDGRQDEGGQVVRASWGDYWVDSDVDVADGEWHHVVVTTTGELTATDELDVDVYIDGQRSMLRYGNKGGQGAPPEMRTVTRSKTSVPLVMGASLLPNPRDREYFIGEIDELYIHAGHMDQGEVGELLSAGAQ